MMTPRISVIVPIYNTERFLPRCLESLANQTLREIEILLVDDGSAPADPPGEPGPLRRPQPGAGRGRRGLCDVCGQ